MEAVLLLALCAVVNTVITTIVIRRYRRLRTQYAHAIRDGLSAYERGVRDGQQKGLGEGFDNGYQAALAAMEKASA